MTRQTIQSPSFTETDWRDSSISYDLMLELFYSILRVPCTPNNLSTIFIIQCREEIFTELVAVQKWLVRPHFRTVNAEWWHHARRGLQVGRFINLVTTKWTRSKRFMFALNRCAPSKKIRAFTINVSIIFTPSVGDSDSQNALYLSTVLENMNCSSSHHRVWIVMEQKGRWFQRKQKINELPFLPVQFQSRCIGYIQSMHFVCKSVVEARTLEGGG